MSDPSTHRDTRSEQVESLLFSADWVALADRRNDGELSEGAGLSTSLRTHAVGVMRGDDGPGGGELAQQVLGFHARYASRLGGMLCGDWHHLCTRGRGQTGGPCPVCDRPCTLYVHRSKVYRSYARELVACPRCGPVIDREARGFGVEWTARRLSDPREIAVDVRASEAADDLAVVAALEHNGSGRAPVSECALGAPAKLVLRADEAISRGVEWVTIVCMDRHRCVLLRRPV